MKSRLILLPAFLLLVTGLSFFAQEPILNLSPSGGEVGQALRLQRNGWVTHWPAFGLDGQIQFADHGTNRAVGDFAINPSTFVLTAGGFSSGGDVTIAGIFTGDGSGLNTIPPTGFNFTTTNAGTVGQVLKRISDTQWYWDYDSGIASNGGSGINLRLTNTTLAVSATVFSPAGGVTTGVYLTNSGNGQLDFWEVGGEESTGYVNGSGFGGGGSQLLFLNASALSSGTIPGARLGGIGSSAGGFVTTNGSGGVEFSRDAAGLTNLNQSASAGPRTNYISIYGAYPGSDGVAIAEIGSSGFYSRPPANGVSFTIPGLANGFGYRTNIVRWGFHATNSTAINVGSYTIGQGRESSIAAKQTGTLSASGVPVNGTASIVWGSVTNYHHGTTAQTNTALSLQFVYAAPPATNFMYLVRVQTEWYP